MDRRSVSRLAALLAAGALLPGCMEAPKNDGRMFQRWAEAIADVPVTDEEAAARGAHVRPAKVETAEVETAEAEAPGITLNAEAAGLRAPIRISVMDPLDLPNARDARLRTAMDLIDPPAKFERAVLTAPVAEPSVAPRRASFAAQLGAFGTRAEAEAAWARVSSRLGGVTPRYEQAVVGGKALVRLKAGPLPTAEAAQRVCRAAGVSDPWCAKAKLG